MATIPEAAAEANGTRPGDELCVEAAGDGGVGTGRDDNPVRALVALGKTLGIHYPPGHLDELRADWDERSSSPGS